MPFSVVANLPVQVFRTTLATHSNRVIATMLGVHECTVSKWRRRLLIAPPRPAQHSLLEVLTVMGTWTAARSLHTPAHSRQRTYEILQALCRRGQVRRRGQPGHYEYALAQED